MTRFESQWRKYLLGILMLFSANAAFATSCGAIIADYVLNGTDSFPNIMVGVVINTRLESKPGADKPEWVGELEVRETLRGKPRDSLRVELAGSQGEYLPSLKIHIGRSYLVLLSDESPDVFEINVCTKPLNLNPNDVAFGDGCKLYRFRELLNIEQTRSRACEVINRAATNRSNKTSGKTFAEEFRRAKWKDLGVDWGG